MHNCRIIKIPTLILYVGVAKRFLCNFVLVFFDDILIYSEAREACMEHLDRNIFEV